MGSEGKSATKGFTCIYSSKLVRRIPNWTSTQNVQKHQCTENVQSIPIPWGGAGRVTGVVCSPCKCLDNGELSYHMGQESSAFLKTTWTKLAPMVKKKWRRNQQWGSRAKSSDIRKFQHGISRFKLDTSHLCILIISSLYQHEECKSRLGHMLPSNRYKGRKIMLFYNILMDFMDNIILVLLFVLFYETPPYIPISR